MAQAVVHEFRVPIGGAPVVEEISLIPGGKGRFEISVDDNLIYSKLETGKHISDADAILLIRAALSR